MYIPNPYFKNIPQIGNLVLDYIFVDDGYPILFTCVAESRLFLCLCRTLTPDQKWILSEIRFQDLEKLIKNELCIRDVFKSYDKGKSCIVKWNKEFVSETYEVIPTTYLSDEELPSKDIFLEEDDAIVYLEQVRNRIQTNIDKNIQVELESNGCVVTNAVSFVDVQFSKEDSSKETYKPKKCIFNTIVSKKVSIKKDEIVVAKNINNNVNQAARDNIAPAA